MDTEKHGPDEINRYEFTGIEERHGIIPGWLIAVFTALGFWMVYYLIRFWRP
ncbi:MAG: hypothetical protein ACRD16_02005 [Thermoanaerobaculia bacterium]